MIKHLMISSFFKCIDEELKYLAEKNNSYFMYNEWIEKKYSSLSAFELKNLKKLELNYINLKELPPEIEYFENLEELNLAGNCLKKLPPEIYTLKKLKVLNLGDIINGGNNIHYLSKNIGNLHNLEKLNLIWNDNLKELPKELLTLKHLDLIMLSQSQENLLKTKIGKVINKNFCIYIEDL